MLVLENDEKTKTELITFIFINLTLRMTNKHWFACLLLVDVVVVLDLTIILNYKTILRYSLQK